MKIRPWSITQLENAFINNQEIDEGFYIAYFVFVNGLISYVFNLVTYSNFILVCESLIGLPLLFFMHKENQGKDFIKKFIVFVLPITLQLLLTFLVFRISISFVKNIILQEYLSWFCLHFINLLGVYKMYSSLIRTTPLQGQVSISLLVKNKILRKPSVIEVICLALVVLMVVSKIMPRKQPPSPYFATKYLMAE